jgi:phospholipid/cholesterol/gamma-HCH transport system substrate-binding protein
VKITDIPIATGTEFVVRVRKNPGHAWLALAIVMAVMLGLLSAYRQGWFTPTVHAYVELPSAAGVQIGTPVKIKGFTIGEIDEITLEKTLSVRARLRLTAEKMQLLGADASGRFGRDGPIGGRYIELVPGSLEGRRLAADSTLPMDPGSELEDVMATVKSAVEKLSIAIGKVDPILDDTRKLTGEAVAMRETVRSSLSTTMANITAMSAELRRTGETARSLVGNINDDRAKLVQDVRAVLKQADAASESAKNALKALETSLPPTLENAREASGDVKQMIRETKSDVPALVRSGRAAAQDASDITTGLKNTWPLSSVIKPPGTSQLPLESFEEPAK